MQEDETDKEIAKKERARLKAQEEQRKEQVEKMREQLNKEASAGEVRIRA